MIMKKTYISPDCTTLELLEESMLAASIEKGDGTVDGGDAWTRKRDAGIGKGLWEE